MRVTRKRFVKLVAPVALTGLLCWLPTNLQGQISIGLGGGLVLGLGGGISLAGATTVAGAATCGGVCASAGLA